MNTQTIPGIANGTISKGQLLKYAAGGWIACTAQGEHSDGVAFSDAVDNGPVTVQVGGIVTYLVGGVTIADGAKITTTAAGLGELAASGDFTRLKAHGAGTANSYAEAFWFDSVAAEA